MKTRLVSCIVLGIVLIVGACGVDHANKGEQMVRSQDRTATDPQGSMGVKPSAWNVMYSFGPILGKMDADCGALVESIAGELGKITQIQNPEILCQTAQPPKAGEFYLTFRYPGNIKLQPMEMDGTIYGLNDLESCKSGLGEMAQKFKEANGVEPWTVYCRPHYDRNEAVDGISARANAFRVCKDGETDGHCAGR